MCVQINIISSLPSDPLKKWAELISLKRKKNHTSIQIKINYLSNVTIVLIIIKLKRMKKAMSLDIVKNEVNRKSKLWNFSVDHQKSKTALRRQKKR